MTFLQIFICKANSNGGSKYYRWNYNGRKFRGLRTISDVRDAVRAYFLLLTKKPKFGEIYNIGGNYSVKLKVLLDDLINLSTVKNKLRIKLDKERLRPIDADLQVPDTSKFRKHTGWKPLISYNKTIKDLLDYWRERIVTKKNNFLVR